MVEEAPKVSAKDIFFVYWRVTIAYPWLLTIVVLSTIGIQLADLGAPLFLRTFFNLLAQGPSDKTVAALMITLGYLALMWFLSWAAQRVQGVANEYLETRAMEGLYTTAFGYLLEHSYNFFISNFAGALVSRVGRFIRSYERILDALLTQLSPTVLFLVGAIVVLSIGHPILGLLLAGWSVVMVAFQIYVSRINQPIRLARSESDSKVTAALSDAIANHNTISLFSGLALEAGRFGDAVRAWRNATFRAWFADNWIWGSMGLFIIAVQSTLLFAAVHYWQLGFLTIGDFVLIQAYLLTTFNRLMGINWQLRGFYDAIADATEMLKILHTPHEVRDIPNAKVLNVNAGKIEFNHVNFAFTKRGVLHDFSLTLNPGEKVALVGPSGAGKSTITKLLLRLYDVHEGTIAIDAQNIADVTQESLRNAIAFVPQEPILFHRTLMENIRYGRRDATDEEVFEAAKKAHCHDFIVQSQEGYNTYVGERGIKLSGGERQRVAIARAILKNAPILILDEATSSLDSESEMLIQDALEVLMHGKTVLVIAHRLSTIMKMDRIVVMQEGAVVAQGSHSELLAQGGLYHKLWSIQAGGFIKGDETENTEMNPSHNGDYVLDENLL